MFAILEQTRNALLGMLMMSDGRHSKHIDEPEPEEPVLSRGIEDQAVPGQPAPSIGEKVPLFAVLVGVNSYPAYPAVGGFQSLRGAVADALDFKDYLETNLAVPSNQITVLTESNATRSAIIDALKNMKDDNRIEKGDAILLYYAGHGTEMDPPLGWEAGGANAKIQALVPYDCDLNIGEERVKPLPDYTLGSLISKIAEEKGDNITVIFDCCHSASGTRGASQAEGGDDVKARYVELKSPECPAQLDAELLESDVGSRSAASSKHLHLGLGSHTLLSACGSGELAKERQGHGLFSSSLLKFLRQVSPDSVSYADILGHPLFPRINGQNPQCEGNNKGRALFNAKVLSPNRKSFPVVQEEDGSYAVKAGTLQRVTLGSNFTLYLKADAQLTSPIGVLAAKKVTPFQTTLEAPTQELDLSQPIIAIVSGINNNKGLRIRIPSNNGKINDIYEALELERIQELINTTVCLVDEPEEHAHIEFSRVDKNSVDIKISADTGDKSKTFSVTDIENDPATLSRVLAHVVNFYGELENTSKDKSILENIQIQFKALKEDGNYDDDLGYGFSPHGDNLYKNDLVELYTMDENGDDVPYGMLITNNSPHDLYVALFHFSPRDLSIVACASPHEAGRHVADVPLKRLGGTLAVGYGAGGYHPLCFEAPEEGDIGFLKVYLTTEPVDLSYIEQSSPFEISRQLKQMFPKLKPKVAWTDKVIPIIQHQKPPTSTF